MACKVFVGNIPPGTKHKELRHLFQNFGIVIDCEVKNRCGFVHMETPTMAETAILALNGSEFKGAMINVEPGRSGDTSEQGPNFGGGNRGFRQGGGPFNPRGGMSNRGGGPSNRGGGQRGGMGGNPFINHGGMQNRGSGIMSGPPGRGGGMGNRGGHNEGRGGFNNRGQNDTGPMRNVPAFKQRPVPYPPINGSAPNDGGGPAARGGKFGGNPRGGFNGPPNRNQNPQQQRNNNWGGQTPNQHGGNFDNMNAMGGGFGGGGGGNMRNPNANANFGGQDRRGFTLDGAQPPMHQQRQQQRNNFSAPIDEAAGGFGNPNMPPQRGRGGGRGNFGPGRGGPGRGGGGRGGFGGGRGAGPGNFGPPPENPNSYNQEFPALQPTRGRGGFGGGNRGGNRGGFNRNAPNMMQNRRQNM